MKRMWTEGNGSRYYKPPEKSEPEYVSDTEEIIVDLDADIVIDHDGSWEYEDISYPWARRDGIKKYWLSESYEYPAIKLADFYEVVEYTDELLEPLLPFAAGRYHISGAVKLVFFVDGIEKYEEYLGRGYQEEEVTEEEYITDDVDITFQYDQSSIEDFEIEELK